MYNLLQKILKNQDDNILKSKAQQTEQTNININRVSALEKAGNKLMIPKKIVRSF